MKSPFKFMGFFMPKTMKTKGNQNRQANEYNGHMLQKYISAFIEN